jgi:predicted PurR-regulated permease PerM
MANSDQGPGFHMTQREIIEIAVRLGLLFVLITWCFRLIAPFTLTVAWGVIVAIALYPSFKKLAALVGGRENMAAIFITLFLIGILVIPAILLTESLLTGSRALADAGLAGELKVSPPPASVAEWPLIGDEVFGFWQHASENLPQLLGEYAPQLRAVGGWLLDTVVGSGLGLLKILVSFVIAGVLLTAAEKSEAATNAIASRLAGDRGPGFAALTTGTIRNVAIGIVGVSAVQAVLLGLGFLLIGLPAAGLLALVALVLCIIQVGPAPVSLLAIIYVFSTADTLPAVVFTIWTLVVSLLDSVLKPMVFGRGAQVPTLVIFLGAIGGMLAHGIIGLFIGAIVLSLGYKLYEAWLQETQAKDVVAET